MLFVFPYDISQQQQHYCKSDGFNGYNIGYKIVLI